MSIMMFCRKGIGGSAVLIKKYGVGALGDNVAKDQDADKQGHHRHEKVEERGPFFPRGVWDGHDGAHRAISSAQV
jgi:hypothetical protein